MSSKFFLAFYKFKVDPRPDMQGGGPVRGDVGNVRDNVGAHIDALLSRVRKGVDPLVGHVCC